MKRSIWLADPPWHYHDKLAMIGPARSACHQYNTMGLVELTEFLKRNGPTSGADGWTLPSFDDLIADPAILFMWATNPFILSGEAQYVMRAWDFEPKQMVPWVKGRLADPYYGATATRLVLNTGMGFYTRGVTEHLLIGTRGNATSLIKNRAVNGLIVAPEEAFILAERGAHSEKPEESYQLIERLCDGPYVELFARKHRPGWECYGDQL